MHTPLIFSMTQSFELLNKLNRMLFMKQSAMNVNLPEPHLKQMRTDCVGVSKLCCKERQNSFGFSCCLVRPGDETHTRLDFVKSKKPEHCYHGARRCMHSHPHPLICSLVQFLSSSSCHTLQKMERHSSCCCCRSLHI